MRSRISGLVQSRSEQVIEDGTIGDRSSQMEAFKIHPLWGWVRSDFAGIGFSRIWVSRNSYVRLFILSGFPMTLSSFEICSNPWTIIFNSTKTIPKKLWQFSGLLPSRGLGLSKLGRQISNLGIARYSSLGFRPTETPAGHYLQVLLLISGTVQIVGSNDQPGSGASTLTIISYLTLRFLGSLSKR